MRKINRAAFLALITISMIGRLAFAQNPPALLVVPSKATMLVGDTRTFRAVGKDGRKQQNVTWNVSPENAAALTTDGDEATLRATDLFATVILTAHTGDGSAEASIEIHSGAALAPGTAIWSVTNLPGCKSGKISQAVPTATGPDLYVEEACPDGTYVRAMTADGREIWRRRLGHSISTIAAKSPAKPLPVEVPLLMGRAYEGDETWQLVLEMNMIPVVPPKSNRLEPWDYDRELCKRNQVERLFRRLKGFRRIFSRFEKLDVVFLAFNLLRIHHRGPAIV
jgi:hypothetical protein